MSPGDNRTGRVVAYGPAHALGQRRKGSLGAQVRRSLIADPKTKIHLRVPIDMARIHIGTDIDIQEVVDPPQGSITYTIDASGESRVGGSTFWILPGVWA